MDKKASNRSESQKDTGEKIMTKYDRKQEARRLAAEKEKKERIRNWIIGGVVIALILVAVLYSSVAGVLRKRAVLKDTYVSVGSHDLTELEYGVYYTGAVNEFLTMYGDYLQYMSIDTSQPFDEQMYDENMTWKDAFDEMAVRNVTQVKAVADDAKAQGFVYEDADADYEKYATRAAEGAEEAGMTLEEYYQSMYGTYATQGNIEPFIREQLLASAYQEHLREQNTPADEEIDAYYEEHKDTYDKVEYNFAEFKADIQEGAEDTEVDAAMDAQKELAEEMQSRIEDGEDFAILVQEYFPADEADEADGPEEDADEAEDEGDSDSSYHNDTTYSYVDAAYSDWLFDEARKAGDTTVVEDESSASYHVVEFLGRSYDDSDTNRENISNTIINERMTEYISALTEKYEVRDAKGKLTYLTIPDDTGEGDEASGDGDAEDGDGSAADGGAEDGDGSAADGSAEDGDGSAADGGAEDGDGSAADGSAEDGDGSATDGE